MSLLVKICGLKTPETVDAALDAGADMLGFVFFGKSPRNLSPDDRGVARRARRRAARSRSP
jgi:phosphoribosylanthranilate isomerase